MHKKTCEWCHDHRFTYKDGKEWKFLCPKCYKEHFVPVKNRYSTKQFRENMELMKSEEANRKQLSKSWTNPIVTKDEIYLSR